MVTINDIKNITDINLLSKIYDLNYNNRKVVIELIKNPNTTENILNKICNRYYKYENIIVEIIKNKNTTEELLKIIYNRYKNKKITHTIKYALFLFYAVNLLLNYKFHSFFDGSFISR